MSKTFVLDTNILLLDNQSMFKFDENTVQIPMIVLEELDKFKKDQSEIGFNARETARILDKLSNKGDLTKGVKLKNGGTLIVKMTDTTNNKSNLDLTVNDNVIVLHALLEEAIMVSRDINVRLKAKGLGLGAENYEPGEIRAMERGYKGHTEITLNADQEARMKKLYLECQGEFKNLRDNEYALVRSEVSSMSRLCRYIKDRDILMAIENHENVLGLKPKNKEQRYALDAILDPDIKLVTLQGKAGTGKTLVAVAAALQQVLDEKYTKLSISRPIQPMGKDLGYLPGTVEEKLAPWMQPIFDNIDFLCDDKKPNSRQTYSAKQMMEQGILEMEAITYIRGRSMPNQLIIVDEAQNLTSHEIKTILTRAGEGTKIILTGDVEQIDTPYLDQLNNGFAYVIDKFKDQKIAAHIQLEKGERSELAELASTIL